MLIKEQMVILKGGVDVPDVDELVLEVKQIQTPKVYRPLYEYGEAIHIMLTEKKMSFREIWEWFSERGFEYTPSHFSNAYLKWRAIKGMTE